MNPDAPLSSPSPAPADPRNLRLRIIWGILAALLLVGCTWGGPVSFGLFFLGVEIVMLKEFYRVMRASRYRPASWLGGIVGGAVFVWLHFFMGFFSYADLLHWSINTTLYPALNTGSVGFLLAPDPKDVPQAIYHWLYQTPMQPYIWLIIGALLVTVLLIREIKLWPDHQQPFVNLAVTLAGILYVSLPMSLLNTLAFHGGHFNPRYVFCLILLIWAADTGAYIAGRLFGRHKLAPNISPGKTWEGWVGGLLLTLFAGAVVAGWLLPAVPLTHRLVAAGVVAVFGPLGDLAESMLKRSAGVKDSGTFLPGHGGLLDRFDAFLLVLPVLALLQAVF